MLGSARARIEAARELGSRLLADGTELIGHIPHVGPDAWLHVVFPPLLPEQLVEVELQLGRKLPRDVSDFLLTANGLSLFAYSLSMYGLRKHFRRTGEMTRQPFSIETPNVSERISDAQESHFFIGGYREDGSHLYLDTTDSRVHRCSPHSVTPIQSWSGIPAMLAKEAERLSRLFDPLGRRVNVGVSGNREGGV